VTFLKTTPESQQRHNGAVWC